MRGNHWSDDMLNNILADLLSINIFGVLRRDNHSINTYRATILILDSDLTLAIGTQIGHWSAASPGLTTYKRELPRELVGQADRHGHIFGRLIAGKAYHHTLITSTNAFQLVIGELCRAILGLHRMADAHIDIRRL